MGVGKLTNEISQVLKADERDSPLEWDHNYRKTYRNQKRVIWVRGEHGERIVLPQTCLITPQEANDERGIQLEVISDEFQPSRPVAGAVEFYEARAKSIGCRFFPDDCARLVGWNRMNRTLLYQRCSYFSYAATNLAMDRPQPVFGTLRKTHSYEGALPDLVDNSLANLAGINCLVFSNDGYMIVQKREKVLIRPGEACSGASGTVTFMDIQHARDSGGRLAKLDAIRENIEELGPMRTYHRKRRFLGASRELIRGGAPEFFYAVNVDMKAEEICRLRRQDVEGNATRFPRAA